MESSPILKLIVRNRKPAAMLTASIGVIASLIFLGLFIAALFATGLRSPARIPYLLGLTTLGFAFGPLFFVPRPGEELADARQIAMRINAMLGIIFMTIGIVMAAEWWGEVFAWLSGKVEAPGKNVFMARLGGIFGGWHVFAVLLAVYGGLALLLLGLEIVRGLERSNVLLRRLIYGYNTVVTGLLLLSIFGLLNVFVSARAASPLDFTASGMYSISSRTQNILGGLQKPVKAILFMDERSRLFNDTATLLTNCKAATNKFDYEVLSPLGNREKIDELRKKYTDLVPNSVLLIYDNGSSIEHRVVPQNELVEEGGRPGRESYKFLGEDAIISKLDGLLEGKQEAAVLYFTQANGELGLTRTEQERNVGLSELKRLLEGRKFQVKPLALKPGDSSIPNDARMVIVAGPKVPFQDYAVKAFRDYLGRRGGKMIFLFDVNPGADGKMVPTGLEQLLKEYNVEVPPERILSFVSQGKPRLAVAIPSAELAAHPLATLVTQRFPQGYMVLDEARPVRPGVVTPNPAGQSIVATTLYQTPEDSPHWTETDVSSSPDELVEKLSKDEALQIKKRIGTPISVCVLVNETSADPNNPHEGVPGFEKSQKTPRMLVLGDATVVSNQAVAGGERTVGFALFSGFVDTLRGRDDSIGIAAKERDVFRMPELVSSNPFSVTLLPLALTGMSLVGLGIGVWVVRRR
jgi:hypothetical protein